MNVETMTNPRKKRNEYASRGAQTPNPTVSLLEMIGTLSFEDQAELERYLRVYRRSGVGNLSGFIAL